MLVLMYKSTAVSSIAVSLLEVPTDIIIIIIIIIIIVIIINFCTVIVVSVVVWVSLLVHTVSISSRVVV